MSFRIGDLSYSLRVSFQSLGRLFHEIYIKYWIVLITSILDASAFLTVAFFAACHTLLPQVMRSSKSRSFL
jgi:hypothetical protein